MGLLTKTRDKWKFALEFASNGSWRLRFGSLRKMEFHMRVFHTRSYKSVWFFFCIQNLEV